MANLQKIKDLSREKKLSISDLAAKCDVTDAGLYKMINTNKIMVDTLEKVADALGVNIGEFFTDFAPPQSASANGANAVACSGNGNNVNTIAETFAAMIQEKDKQITITQGQMDRLIDMLDDSTQLVKKLTDNIKNNGSNNEPF